MKNKKTLLFVLLIILSFGTCSVKADRIERAGNAIVKVYRERAHTGIFIGNTGEEVLSSGFNVNFNGNTYSGYCLDYSFHASGTMVYTCNPDTHAAAAALTYAYEHRTGDHLIDTLTMRFIAIRLDKSQGYETMPKAKHMLIWLQIRTGQLSADDYSSDDTLTGDDASLAQLEEAYKKSDEAIAAVNAGYTLETPTNSLTFTNKKVNGKEVTYTVKSNNPIDKSKLAFTCTGCNIKNNIQDTWTGTEGTLIVEDTGNDCSYEINAYYPGSNAYTCTSAGDKTQQIEIFVGSELFTPGADGGVDTSGYPTQKYSDTINEGSYYEGVCEPTGCAPIPDDQVEVNNCCEDSTTSKVSEPVLNDLFCRDDDLKVDYYDLKTGINKYLQTTTDLDSNYCQMYCTERTQVDIPGALTATNGKYFKLAQNPITGTYAPHTQSTKRCRIRIEYDKWLTDYKKQVDASIVAYNEYQKNKAYEAAYNEEVKKEQEKDAAGNLKNLKSATVTVNCSKAKTCKTYGGYNPDGTRKCTDYDDGYNVSKTFGFHYYVHNFSTYSYTKVKQSGSSGINGIGIVSDGLGSISLSTAYRITDYDTVQKDINTYINEHSDGSCSVSGDMYKNAGKEENKSLYFDDVAGKANYYSSQATANNNSYTAAVSQVQTLQQTLTRCDKYFVDDSVSSTNSAEQMYNLPTSLSSFRYTQVYQDDYGNPKETQVTVGFDGRCEYKRESDVSSPDTFAISGTGTNYSDTYGKGFANMNVFNTSKALSYTTNFNQFLSTYSADKMFWHDGRYTATCDWYRTDVDKYTVGTDGKVVTTNPSTDDSAYRLVPRGEIYNYKSSLVNYSEHEYVYSYSTSYDGKFETYWDLKGLGEGNKFDKYFEAGGGTCANQNPGDTALLTCSLSSFHGGSFYGCCCGDAYDTTYSTATCDSYNDKAVKYEFKIVDPAKMFPADTDGYADNWKTTLGNTAREAIEELGKNLSTYSPKTLSYSFVLTPSDMKQIKKYNSIMNSYGGYTDSDLTCDCSEVQGEGNKDNGKSCTKCTSSFLDNLASGKILKDSNLSGGWNRSDKTIAEVRNSGNVIWAVNR